MEKLMRYYEILGIPASATLDELKQAFYNADNRLQADLLSDEPHRRQQAQESLHEIAEAHEHIMRYLMEHGQPKFSSPGFSSKTENSVERSASDNTTAPEAAGRVVTSGEFTPAGEPQVSEVPESSDDHSTIADKLLRWVMFGSLFILVAFSVGALIGISIFRHSTKGVVAVHPDKASAGAVSAFKQHSAAAQVAIKENVPVKQETESAIVVKRHKKRATSQKKHHVKAHVATMDPEQVDKIRLSAEQGDAEAQYRLGVMYARGQGVKKDPAAALKWYRRSAGQGYGKAQEALEIYYE